MGKKLNAALSKIKELETKLTNQKCQTLECYTYSKKSLQVLSTNHYMASGLIVTITDLQGVDKFKCMIEDGLSTDVIDNLENTLQTQINRKLAPYKV